MKLLKQKILYFSEGKSDKVYEVDLCEAGKDLFVVNFRYGRRDSNLRDGTKTVFPVSYNEALNIFDTLVESKEKKGYSENAGKVVKTKPVVKQKLDTAREKTILKYLEEANLGTYTRNWKISRIIMRTTVLNMKNAVELIKPFIKSKDDFEQYAAIFALAYFEDASEVEHIFTIFKQKGFSDKVGRIAMSFVLKYGSETHYKQIQESILNQKPQELTFDSELINSLSFYLFNNKDIDANSIFYAYIFAYKDEKLKSKLYDFLQNAALKVNIFKSIRYIYRSAEITNDIPFLTLLAKRIAISNPVYSSSSWGVYIDGNYINPSEEKIKKSPKVAFSSATKAYFNKAAYKLVYNFSKNDSNKFVNYATNLLCSLDDKIDNEQEEVQQFWSYDYENSKYNVEKRHFPKYSTFLALMYIAYGNSAEINGVNRHFFTQELKDLSNTRTEVLPEIWNTKPEEVLTILANAKSEIAINFALHILKENLNFLDKLSQENLAKLVSHYDERVVNIILPVLKEKYRTTQPEESVLLKLIASKNKEASDLAFEWLKKYERNYFAIPGFISKLLLTKQLFVIDYLIDLYKDILRYNFPFKISEIIAFFETSQNFETDYLLLINKLIGETKFGKLLSETTADDIRTLAKTNILSNKLFAINLAKHNITPAFQIFKDDFDTYINSDEKMLRKAGIEILAYFPDEFLLENQYKIASYCFSEHIEVREAIFPTIERLLKIDTVFKETLKSQLLNTIIKAEEYDGVHESSYALLVKYYDNNLASISTAGIIDLVLSDYDFAQKLGTPIFKDRVVLKDLNMPQLISLSTSAVLEIRNILKQYFKEDKARINFELEMALKIFNSKWQDIIDWACLFFDKHIESKNWTLEMLIYVCDHTKKDVQAFGRKMITTHFSEEKGLPLLLKLQEHPTKAMQFFVTNYLENYASNKVEVILQLESFFKTTLFNINTNRVAKSRIYAFLKQEAIKNEAVAKMTIKLIKSVLGTKTKIDNSNNIDLLLEIMDAFPNLENPLIIKTI